MIRQSIYLETASIKAALKVSIDTLSKHRESGFCFEHSTLHRSRPHRHFMITGAWRSGLATALELLETSPIALELSETLNDHRGRTSLPHLGIEHRVVQVGFRPL